jgi:poly(A) polymerase
MTALPPALWRQWPELTAVMAALTHEGGAARVVGGAVRDTLLGLPVADVDLATPLMPEQVAGRLGAAGIKTVPTGIAHGTVTAVANGRPFEVTTLRRDVATDGRRATVAFSDDWQEDAARRDFTINALYADPATGEIWDWFGGQDDLAAGIVRFIGDPATRIAEDHLRTLRFYRFAARFGRGTLDPASHAAVIAARTGLRTLSRERVADELLKLLALPDPAPMLTQMAADAVLAEILPEADAASLARLGCLLTNECAVAAAPDALRRLAALLPGSADAQKVAARLRLSNRKGAWLIGLTRWREQIRTVPLHEIAYRRDPDMARDAWLLAGEPSEIAGIMAALDGWARPTFPVRGGALVALGVPPGPDVARLFQAAEADWLAAGCPPEFNLAAWLGNQGSA